jgi:hypothetical protein
MADLKISQLTGATTPLAGTEVLPIVQSGSTKQVSVANLTAGRSVSVSSLTASGNIGAANMSVSDSNWIGWGNYNSRFTGSGGGPINVVTNSVTAGTWDTNQNYTFYVGNLVQGTAAKGVNFTANTPAAGMTSQLLNWYETGTWTPTYVPTSGAFGAITYNAITYGRYTRVGNVVVVLGLIVTDAITVGTAAGLVYIAGLPFTPATSASSAINYSSGFNTNNPSGGYTSGNQIYPTYRTTANGASTNLNVADLDTGAFKNYVIFQATYVV